jgi:PPM family protein phosphatase
MTTELAVTTAYATTTRQGTGANNADASAVFVAVDGTVAAAVIDLIGHQANAPFVARLLAEAAARVGAQRGPFAGLLSAGLMIADPGAGDEPEPDGVGACATISPDGLTVISWLGDAHAYGWDGSRLARYTTPHTYGQQLAEYGAPWEIAADHTDWIVTSLSAATPATVLTVTCDDPLILLASDGIDSIPDDVLAELVRQHADAPQALADAIVAAVEAEGDGYRDDATVVVIRSAVSY